MFLGNYEKEIFLIWTVLELGDAYSWLFNVTFHEKEVKQIKDKFLKKYKVNSLTISTLNKKSVSDLKSKLIKYVTK